MINRNLIVVFFCLVLSSTAFATETKGERSSELAETLADGVFAIHRSNSPLNNKIIAANKIDGKFLPGVPTRLQVHFSLGTYTGGFQVEHLKKAKYAVVTPLRAILPQTIVLNAYDTFILGDFHFTRETYYFLPAGEAVPTSVANIVQYDAEKLSLNTAIDNFIKQKKGIFLELQEDSDEYEVTPIRIDGRRAKQEEYFQPLVAKHPWIKISSRWADKQNRNGSHLFGTYDVALSTVLLRYLYLENCGDCVFPREKRGEFESIFKMSSRQLEARKAFVLKTMQDIRTYVEEAGFPEAAVNTVQEQQAALREWIKFQNKRPGSPSFLRRICCCESPQPIERPCPLVDYPGQF